MASVKLKLRLEKVLSDGTHPIILQVIHNRTRKIFFLGHSANKEQWDTSTNLPNTNHPNFKSLKLRIKSAINELEGIILDFENKKKLFTVEDVEKAFKNKFTDETLTSYVNKLIEEFKANGKPGNAAIYKHNLATFLKFTNNKDLQLYQVDYLKVKAFENFLIRRGIKVNSISIHLRTLRAIINRAIKDGLLEESEYPFKKITITSEKTRKRAINKELIKKIEDLNVSELENLQLYKDIFLFSFYNRGMNFVDIAYLQVKNIQEGRINYYRKKTGQQFSIRIADKTMEILNRYCDLHNPDSYIFPIIYRKSNEYLDYRNAMRLINKKLKLIQKSIGLDVPLTTYVTRHSWATIAKKAGVSTAVISEGLGHETEETTQIYLDSFENSVLDDANDLIID